MTNKKRPTTEICPDCGEPTFPTSFGMPVAEDPTVIEMGCSVMVPSPDRGCKACGWVGDYIDIDGSPVELDFFRDEED